MRSAKQVLIDNDCFQDETEKLSGRIISTNVDKFDVAMNDYLNERLNSILDFLYKEITERRHYSASKSFEVVVDKIKQIQTDSTCH